MTSKSRTSQVEVDDSTSVSRVLQSTNFDCAKVIFSLKQQQDAMESDFEDEHPSDASQRIEQTSYDSVIEKIIDEVRLTTLSTPLELDLLSTCDSCDANAATSSSSLHSGVAAVIDSFVHQKISTPKQHSECATISNEMLDVSTAEQRIQFSNVAVIVNDVNSAMHLNTDIMKLPTDIVSNLNKSSNNTDEICDQHKINNDGICDTVRNDESIMKFSSNLELNDADIGHTSNIQVPVLLTEEEIKAITIESRFDDASTVNSSIDYSNEKTCIEISSQEEIEALSEFTKTICDEKINYKIESSPSSSSALSTTNTDETIQIGESNDEEIKLATPMKSEELKQPDCLNSREKYDECSSLNEVTSELTTTLHSPSDLNEGFKLLESLQFADEHFSLDRGCTDSSVAAGSTDATAHDFLSTLSSDVLQKPGTESSSPQSLSTEQKSMKSRFKDFWRINHKEKIIGNENFFIKRLHDESK
ncbi:hypothetical protein B566_EDAN002210 [Ephemera danica]|nr:hypothetical protein B566_EDAN002210 [Ephemera danica]